jgi:hypothetical protein
MQRGKRSARAKYEDGALAARSAAGCSAIEIPIAPQNERCLRQIAVAAVEVMQRGQRAAGRHFEYRAGGARSANVRRAVEVAVGALQQRRKRDGAIGT